MICPRRSVLYMPGSNVKAMEKAKTLPVDCVIFDLEDAVASASKIIAREQVVQALRTGGYGAREVAVRINALDTEWGLDDLRALAECPPAAVVLPKVNSAADVHEVADRLPDGVALWAMIETATGVQNVDEIAAAHSKLTVLVMGTSDLAAELRVPHTPQRTGLLYALSRGVVAARANGLDIIDGVYLDIADAAGFAAVRRHGRELGFDGKSLIHPAQIDEANWVFAPSAAEKLLATRIIAAWESAAAQGEGVIVLDGKLIENLHVAEAQRLLNLCARIP